MVSRGRWLLAQSKKKKKNMPSAWYFDIVFCLDNNKATTAVGISSRVEKIGFTSEFTIK